MAFLDSTVVNVALPHLGRDLRATVSGLQWTVTGYTLTLAAFVLLGGALGDRYGRRRVFLVGVTWFTLASVLCGLSAGVAVLVVARALQGCGAALLTPGGPGPAPGPLRCPVRRAARPSAERQLPVPGEPMGRLTVAARPSAPADRARASAATCLP